MKFFVNKLLRFIICGVCWDSDMIEFPYCCMKVSMPHAALCVSGQDSRHPESCGKVVSMPHAALCVSGLCVPQPLSRAGCTVLERRNGGMRLCARAGALSISFFSMIAYASFFFNDVFASMRGRADAFPKVYMLPFILLSTSIHFLFIMSFAGENLYGAIADNSSNQFLFIVCNLNQVMPLKFPCLKIFDPAAQVSHIAFRIERIREARGCRKLEWNFTISCYTAGENHNGRRDRNSNICTDFFKVRLQFLVH